MARFRIRLKLQAFEVDGEREDIPAITSAVQQQFAGLLQPAESMADETKQLGNPSTTIEGETGKNKKSSARRRPTSTKVSADGVAGQAIDFRHDSARYGNPSQTWSKTDKAIWLLSVVKGVAGIKEVSGPQIAATFNQYFKQAGKVHPPNVTMMLGKAKVLNPAPVGEDKGLWFLTDEGDRQAQALIQSVLSPSA